MKVNLPFKLSALRQVTAAQLQAMYDAVATVLNGNVGRDNFAPHARIGNANKAAPRSWLVLEGELWNAEGNAWIGDPTDPTKGSSVLRWKVPSVGASARLRNASVVRWSVDLASLNGGLVSLAGGGIYLVHYPASGGASSGDTYSIGAGATSVRFDRAWAKEVAPGDVLELGINGMTLTGTERIGYFAASVWLEMDHLP